MAHPEDIKRLIEAGIPGAQVRVTGDGRHFEAVVICGAFAGQSIVAQHQMVYKALGEKMRAEIHALSIRTLTRDAPEQAAH
ncbi:MAG: BolA/IbaG family iron-sulfur metabolism protein [Gammaproteobacteria bacterium]|nr:BolA/IbaG family iron-sulfur metabolism protein [Gammaproteobacteria bacterium]